MWELPCYRDFSLANFATALLTYGQMGRGGSLIGVKLHPRSPPETETWPLLARWSGSEEFLSLVDCRQSRTCSSQIGMRVY